MEFRPHPWHGLSQGQQSPEVVRAYIEITPFDLVKYEVDKETGYLKIDRPQRTSSQPPALYGFIPRTYCGPKVGALSGKAERGDSDPLDICVLSERPVAKSEILVDARVVGGLLMIDKGEADDKIIAVLENDLVWGGARDIADLPAIAIERLIHYFTTYKLKPGEAATVMIDEVYGRDKAFRVIETSIEDYNDSFVAADVPG